MGSDNGKQKKVMAVQSPITTTEELIDHYLFAAYTNVNNGDGASSSTPKRRRI
jgi:hypothetical protein